MKSKLLAILAFTAILFASMTHTVLATQPGDQWCTPAGGAANTGINTALGCISTTADPGQGSFFEAILKIAIGLGGGLALVLMLYGVFIVTTSAGIPDKLKEGGDVITSAVTGLIFIILSVFLLNFIGINILGLPGLS